VSAATAIACALFSGCSPFGGGNEEELREVARSFVPGPARISAEKPGACVELAAYPSCMTLYYTSSLPADDRERLTREAGDENGWDLTDARVTRSGVTWLWFEKSHFSAIVRIEADGDGTVRVLD
jgi:hypothetical protein